jgi:hypothetical protein
MDDPIDSAFQSRRFAHGKSKAKSGRGGGGGAAKPFNPLAALGRYEVSLGVGNSKYQHVLEIHELTESETGLLGTFDFAELTGMFVLAGSRKQLAEIISGFEENDHDAESDHEDSNESYEDGTGDSEDEPSALELQDEKLNRRARAFEKNSFRNPKFWMKWKGKPAAEDDGGSSPVESDIGYLVFSNNACDKFDGTITCPALDWKQLKLKARKIHSKATPCPAAWNDIS